MQWKFTPSSYLLAIILFLSASLNAQVNDTIPNAIDPDLIELGNSRVPKEYTLAGIKISGTKYLDEQLLISISGLNVGDKLVIPGGDHFSKAIANLWKQNLFANVHIYFTKPFRQSNLFSQATHPTRFSLRP